MIFGKNTTSDISKLSYVISRAVRRVKFETNLKYHEWCLCQISRTNHASIICLYTTRKRVVIFTCRYFKLSWNTTANQVAKISHVVQHNKSNGTCNSITACGISSKYNSLSVHQSGFRKKLATETATVHFVDHILDKWINKGLLGPFS